MHAHGREAAAGLAYARHRPEQTQLYCLVEQHYPAFVEHLAEQGKALPAYVGNEFEAYLKCGRLEHGFLRVRCESCHFERLVAFSCKRRGFCPSCGARCMAETAALLADEVLPPLPLRQWVISFPFALRFLFASRPDALARALEVIYRLLATHLAHKAGFRCKEAATGAVTLVQRFGSALNLNIHLHTLCLDGVYTPRPDGGLRFARVKAPEREELEHLVQQIAERVARALERMGLLQRDAESAWLDLPPGEDTDAMRQLIGSAIERHVAMSWAQRLKRVFGIDAETCVRCGSAVRVIASIEEPVLIERILEHVRGKTGSDTASLGPPSTGPPVSA